MAQPSAPSTLPGIVTDQPEIFESPPIISEDAGLNDADLGSERTDEDVAIIEVPIKQAFSYFAERENEIAKFFVQTCGEYKIRGSGKVDDETEIEKYHRLVSEVNELLYKFQSQNESSSDELTKIGSLNHTALTNNLKVLASQLKALEFAAEEGNLNPTQAEFNGIESKLKNLEIKDDGDKHDREIESSTQPDDKKEAKIGGDNTRETINLVRMSAFERRLNLLESVLGHNESKAQSILKTTKCESLADAADTLKNWLSLFRPESVQKVKKELDFLTQKLEAINEQINSDPNRSLDPTLKTRLDQLCDLLVSSDKSRGMVPTIIHRLNAMEELQQKAAYVTSTLNHLEQVQAQLKDSLQSNKKELTSLNEMFSKNLDLIKEYSKDIDRRIVNIREKD